MSSIMSSIDDLNDLERQCLIAMISKMQVAPSQFDLATLFNQPTNLVQDE